MVVFFAGAALGLPASTFFGAAAGFFAVVDDLVVDLAVVFVVAVFVVAFVAFGAAALVAAGFLVAALVVLVAVAVGVEFYWCESIILMTEQEPGPGYLAVAGTRRDLPVFIQVIRFLWLY